MKNIIEEISIWNYTRKQTEYDKGFEYRMLEEELEEFKHSTSDANEAKEIADIIFVAVGALYKASGANLNKAQAIMKAVIDANHAKGNKKVGGKVQKGEDYINPEVLIERVLEDGGSLWSGYLNDNKHIYKGV